MIPNTNYLFNEEYRERHLREGQNERLANVARAARVSTTSARSVRRQAGRWLVAVLFALCVLIALALP